MKTGSGCWPAIILVLLVIYVVIALSDAGAVLVENKRSVEDVYIFGVSTVPVDRVVSRP